MSDIVVDLTNYKDKVGARIQPGRYVVVVEDAETDTAKSGNPMINVWLRVLGGEFDGSTVVDRLVITPNSLFRIVGFMQAIGLPTPKKKLKLNVGAFIGRTLEIDVEDGDPYNGRIKTEVRGYMRHVADRDADAGDGGFEEFMAGGGDSADDGDDDEAKVDLDQLQL